MTDNSKMTCNQQKEFTSANKQGDFSLGSSEYREWLADIKKRIATAQIRVALAANKALIHFYFELGEVIVRKQAESKWGDGVITQLSNDLQREFSDLKGLSTSNLKYCKRFFLFYRGSQSPQPINPIENNAWMVIGQHAVDQIPWGHNILISWFPSSSLGTRFHEALASRNPHWTGSWSFQDCIPKLELGNERKFQPNLSGSYHRNSHPVGDHSLDFGTMASIIGSSNIPMRKGHENSECQRFKKQSQ